MCAKSPGLAAHSPPCFVVGATAGQQVRVQLSSRHLEVFGEWCEEEVRGREAYTKSKDRLQMGKVT